MLTFSPLIASIIRGYVTPRKIEKILVIIKILFMDRNDSLEPETTNFEEFKAGSRYAKIVRASRVIEPEKLKRYNPLSGSFANECTLSIIPDLTINAPNRLNAKIRMPKNMVQVLRTSDFEDANKECMNAVAASQGIRATFSTGSQNQYPPQPNS